MGAGFLGVNQPRKPFLVGCLDHGGHRLGPAADAGRDGLLAPHSLRGRALGWGLDGVGGFQRLDALGQLGNAGQGGGAWLRCCAGQAGLELVAQGGEALQVGGVGKGLPNSRLVVAELALGDAPLAAGGGASIPVAVGEAVERIENGPRPVVLP